MYHYRAHIISVYDADTCTADIDLGFGVWMKNQKLRLYGINAPEIRTKDKREKKLGEEARDWLMDKLTGKMVELGTVKGRESDEKGKFGRWLATIHLDGEIINDTLVQEGYAKYHDY